MSGGEDPGKKKKTLQCHGGKDGEMEKER